MYLAFEKYVEQLRSAAQGEIIELSINIKVALFC